jgi:hypothetical protein
MRKRSTSPNTGHVVRLRRRALVTLPAIACATLIGACGSSSAPKSSSTNTTPSAILDTKRIALSIEQEVLRERHTHVTVTCPAVVPEQKDRNFACLAHTAHSTSKTPVVVTQQNNSGYVTYKVE